MESMLPNKLADMRARAGKRALSRNAASVQEKITPIIGQLLQY